MKEIIQQSLLKAYDYPQYKQHIDELLSQGKTTGCDHSEPMVSLTRLNRQRIKSLDNTWDFSPEELAPFAKNTQKQTWLIISEGWCADAAQIVPVLEKIALANPLINLKIVLRDENEALMNLFLTNGGKAIPILIILDSESLEVLHVWGPRPKTATLMVEAYKKEHGSLSPEFKEELQKWYNQDKGQSILADLTELLK